MNWQLIAVIVIVSCAVFYLTRQMWGTFAGKKGCGSGCGCSAKPPATEGQAVLISPQQITLRRRDSGPL